MNKHTIAAAAAILGLVVGGALPAFADAANGASPIAVSDVRILASDLQNSASETMQPVYVPGTVDVTFRNTGNVAARAVTFAVNAGGREVGTLTDTGTFAPGVAIEHVFVNDTFAPNAQLSVARVTFADGTVWTSERPAVRQAAR